MKKLPFILSLGLIAAGFASCDDSDDTNCSTETLSQYTVTVENVSTSYVLYEAGQADTPNGETVAGGAAPGKSFSFSFHAGIGHKVSFAGMYGASNDLFYAPDGEGIALYDENGDPVTGDVTSQVYLWDDGTEVNEVPGVGANTGPNQSSPDAGVEENGNVVKIEDTSDTYAYPAVDENIKVSLAYDQTSSMFTLTLEVLPTSTTGVSPLTWVVTSIDNPLFTEGEPDYGYGLEQIAQSGDGSILTAVVTDNAGFVSPIAPVAWVINSKDEAPIFTEGEAVYDNGLETLAESGSPVELNSALSAANYYTGVASIPEGESEAGPLFPGDKYTFTVEAEEGEYLNFASMLGASNDIFFSFDNDMGIELSSLSGDVTSQVTLWDAGTEVNEYAGARTNANVDENGVVHQLTAADGEWPAANQQIKVTITRN